jgi:Cu-Zn family superoxide dismutase
MQSVLRRAAGLAPAAIIALAITAGFFGRAAADPPPLGFATIWDANGALVGAASFQRVADGLEIRARFQGLPPGQHGYHIHAVARCDPPSFATAEQPFNPTMREHGLQNPLGPQVGDLPNLTVGEDGTANMTAIARYATLFPSDTSLFDQDGSALVIHAAPDDGVTNPDGNAGPRIACGVLGAGPAHDAQGHLFVNQSPETRAAFKQIWGDYAPEEWALERDVHIAEEALRIADGDQ